MFNRLIRCSSNHLENVFPQTARLVSFVERRGWEFSILGRAPMLGNSVRLKEWLLVPAHEDTSQIPARTLTRIRNLFDAGIRPQGFVVAHEAPRALPIGELITDTKPQLLKDTQFENSALSIGYALGAFASLAITVAGSVLFTGLAAGVLVLDPILIAVTQDDFWIEIDRWEA